MKLGMFSLSTEMLYSSKPCCQGGLQCGDQRGGARPQMNLAFGSGMQIYLKFCASIVD